MGQSLWLMKVADVANERSRFGQKHNGSLVSQASVKEVCTLASELILVIQSPGPVSPSLDLRCAAFISTFTAAAGSLGVGEKCCPALATQQSRSCHHQELTVRET